MGDDFVWVHLVKDFCEFLPTSPVWGTTHPVMGLIGATWVFLPTSPVWGTTKAYW